MEKQRIPPLLIAPLSLALLGPALPWLTGCPALAGAYKCREPDGHIGYQEMPCPAESDGGLVIPNTVPPSGAKAARTSKAYSVEGQLKALESARRQGSEARKARKKSSDTPRKSQTKTEGHDAARCAKHRAEVARWRRDVRNGYRDKDEREQETQMLRHHEALVARYCEPER